MLSIIELSSFVMLKKKNARTRIRRDFYQYAFRQSQGERSNISGIAAVDSEYLTLREYVWVLFPLLRHRKDYENVVRYPQAKLLLRLGCCADDATPSRRGL